MAITIKGVRLEGINLARKDDGDFTISSSEYSLISSIDKVLAKQTVGGYGGLALSPSGDTVKALRAFSECYQRDIVDLLGLEG